MAECKSCNEYISEEATICPYCREPDPVAKPQSRLQWWRDITILIITPPTMLYVFITVYNTFFDK